MTDLSVLFTVLLGLCFCEKRRAIVCTIQSENGCPAPAVVVGIGIKDKCAQVFTYDDHFTFSFESTSIVLSYIPI